MVELCRRHFLMRGEFLISHKSLKLSMLTFKSSVQVSLRAPDYRGAHGLQQRVECIGQGGFASPSCIISNGKSYKSLPFPSQFLLLRVPCADVSPYRRASSQVIVRGKETQDQPLSMNPNQLECDGAGWVWRLLAEILQPKCR
jgi:hypothetical protein